MIGRCTLKRWYIGIITVMLLLGMVIASIGCHTPPSVEKWDFSTEGGVFKGNLKVNNLQKNGYYALCINQSDWTSPDMIERLKAHPDHQMYGSEVFINICAARADAGGTLDTTFELKGLQEGEYRVKFAIKDMSKGWEWIEIDPDVRFEITAAPP